MRLARRHCVLSTVASVLFVFTPAVAQSADLNGDGIVGTSDLLILLVGWGPCPDSCQSQCLADLDGDCVVGVTDLALLLCSWDGLPQVRRGFSGVIILEDKTDDKAAAAGLFVCNVYAEFDNPADQLILVGFATITASSSFYQNPLGGDTAPSQSAIDADPLAQYDSFVTIGVKVNDGGDTTLLTPDSGGFFDASQFSGTWFHNPNDSQGDPVDGRVLIGQLTTTECPSSITGNITVMSAGSSCGLDQQVEFTHICEQIRPCPWDCQPVPDGQVGINDFLDLLAQWGGPGSCDFDGGGVGINDFLELLANWGPCP